MRGPQRSSSKTPTLRNSTLAARADADREKKERRKGKGGSAASGYRERAELHHERVRDVRRRGADIRGGDRLNERLSEERQPVDLEGAVNPPDLVASDGRVVRRIQALASARTFPVHGSSRGQRGQGLRPLPTVDDRSAGAKPSRYRAQLGLDRGTVDRTGLLGRERDQVDRGVGVRGV